MSAEANANFQPGEMNLLYHAGSVPSALMFAALKEQDRLCGVFGECRWGATLGREIGDLCGAHGPVNPTLFAYVRYEVDLSRKGLDEMGLTNEPGHIQKLGSITHMHGLGRV